MAVLTNTMMQGTAAISDDGYEIEKSLRFSRGDRSYLKKKDKAGDRRRWTWSGWIKKTDTTNSQTLFSATGTNGAQTPGAIEVRILSGSQLYIAFCESQGTTIQWSAENKAFYRDPAAWQHWVIALDTPNPDANERCKVYVNGRRVEDWGTRNTITRNFEYGLSQDTKKHLIGAYYSGGQNDEHLQEFADAHYANVEFCDGLVLPPKAFAARDEAGKCCK